MTVLMNPSTDNERVTLRGDDVPHPELVTGVAAPTDDTVPAVHAAILNNGATMTIAITVGQDRDLRVLVTLVMRSPSSRRAVSLAFRQLRCINARLLR